jgi:hypothetical protein
MIVVTDSGPIIHLSMVKQLDLLPRFYGEVVVPRVVYQEVVDGGAGLPGSAELREAAWARVHDSRGDDLVEKILTASLDPGESAALSLAVHLKADWLLVDDLQARHAARKLNLQHIGTLGILLAARKRGFVPAIRPLLRSLRTQGFWMSESIERAILKQADEAE